MRALAVAIALLALASGAARAAAPKPDHHDRVLAAKLNAKVATFRAIVGSTGSKTQSSLNDCPLVKKDPSQAFAVLFAAVPALLTQMVGEYKPQLVALRATLGSLHPDAPLFRQWITALGQSFDLLLQFDNHGKKVDLCRAATVMLDKHSTAADIHRVLGIDPLLVAKIFAGKLSTKVNKLNPRMRTFFIAAGLSKKNATTLTSSSA